MAARRIPRRMTRSYVIATLLVSATALAQSAEDKQEAAALVERADAANAAGDHEMAGQLYQRAYKLDPRPQLLVKVATAYQTMGKSQWALTYYCEYLSTAPAGDDVAAARTNARTLHVELGGDASATDADICRPVTRESTPPPATDTTRAAAPVASASRPLPETPDEDPDGTGTSSLRVASLALAGVGAIAFGVGVYYGLQARSIANELTNHPVEEPWPVDLRAREERGESYNRRAIALMAGGGAAVALGVAAYVVLRPSSSPADAVTVAPVLSPDGIGLAAAARF